MHKKYKENVWKINTNECFLCHHMHRVSQGDAPSGGQPDNRTGGQAGAVKSRLYFATLR